MTDPLETPEGQRIDLSTIRSAAEGARTRDEWRFDIDEDCITIVAGREAIAYMDAEAFELAEHIATMDPQTTLLLLDRLEEAEQERDAGAALLRDWLDAQGDEEFRVLTDATRAFLAGLSDKGEG